MAKSALRSWSCTFLLFLGICGVRAQEHNARDVQEVRIGVLGLFHPKEIIVMPSAKPLNCSASFRVTQAQAGVPVPQIRVTQAQARVPFDKLKAGSVPQIPMAVRTNSETALEDRWTVSGPMHIAWDEGALRIAGQDKNLPGSLACDDGQGGASQFTVTVPGKLTRRYRGRLEVQTRESELVVIVAMELETAVASIVAAESPPGAPLEALKAQAVASRSFLLAGKGRHNEFDFCDTTHCQFLRQPPAPESPAARAARETAGLVLAYKGEAFAAMYSASCGGRTHSLEELGIPVHGYPYFAVECSYCRRHPEKWVAKISEADAGELAPTESSRLRLARKLGWKTVPGNSYSSRNEGGAVVLEGVGVGHGIGLCQRGAADMARQGASFRQILEHYYPNAEVRGSW